MALDGELSFNTVSEIHPELTRALEGGKDLAVDYGKLGHFDLAGVQLLLALKVSAAERGISVSFSGRENEGRVARMLSFAGLPALQD